MFFKFQSRLSDIENEVCCFIASRTSASFKNRFGRSSSYYIYSSCIPKEKLIELYNKYN